ncbi:MAG: hypothetical protein O3A10_01370 [Chloroflexi bacterium]|nr:hypothetical protein [Chloroflexota bacterium]MDA1146025.1 hypothetical protein [Chloroflexota bacterium]
MLDVKVVPHQIRPGVGLMPASEGRRTWLPQQSRFCPVLEDGNRMGFLVYPPLEEDETYQVRYEDDGSFRFTFYKQKQIVLTLLRKLSAGSGEGATTELVFFDEDAGLDRRAVMSVFEAMVMNLGAPIGGVGVRGAYDFVTPPGWDTVYTGLLNNLARPQVPVLTVQVQTDWFRHPTEFRHVLRPGEGVSASGFAPVGQVFFVPRSEVGVTLASDEEQAVFNREFEEYWRRKPDHTEHTRYGGTYDYQYRAESRPHLDVTPEVDLSASEAAGAAEGAERDPGAAGADPAD